MQLSKFLRAIDFTGTRFLVVGVANTLAGLLTIFAAKYILGMGDILANMTGYAVGISLSFTLNARWTFRYSGKFLPAFTKFAIVLMLAYCLNLLTVMTAIRVFTINSYIAQALGIVPYTLFTYLASRLVVFPVEVAEE